ncbi:MAG: hypothetical protein A2289_12985 [Deltaproteobacteria bacterium RIFOXYA12_FULL_58_15]|nr:MAG: hypothetical protein A2289_12985 [Deltaproteobacteria bacterium RIFOXYA12_FULL_58_15]OGR10153.1 MAG: hypothetical protein A2341_06180 [Deltaproteobacteria bacterium RIFOXYB12_FULL_58_9]
MRAVSQRGWSLVELGIVFVVVGVMIGVAAPRMSGFMETAKMTAVEEELVAIANVVDEYSMKAPVLEGYSEGWDLSKIGGNGQGHFSKGNSSSPKKQTPKQSTDTMITLLPVDFDGLSPYEKPYVAQIYATPKNPKRHILEVLTCVPSEFFGDHDSGHPSISTDCGGSRCDGGDCELFYSAQVVPSRLLGESDAEKKMSHANFSLPTVLTRGEVAQPKSGK